MDKLKTPASDGQSDTQGLENKARLSISQSNIAELDAGECQLIGPKRQLIPEGEYEATFDHYETTSLFTKKVKKVREGGKVYLWFHIDPFNNSDQINSKDNIRLYISYNAASVQNPTGKNGKFKMTRAKKFVADYERLIGGVKRRDRISPNNYKGKMLRVRVRTVEKNRAQEKYSADECYSVIDELIEISVG